MYNKEITQLRTILKLIGFKPCIIGDRNWLEFTNNQTPLLDYKAKPGDVFFGKTNDKIGSWRFQRCPIQVTHKGRGKNRQI